MPETPAQWLVGNVALYRAQFARGFITALEFTSKVFDQWAVSEGVYVEIIPKLWDLIPEGARTKFIEMLRAAATPDFRWPPFLIGASQDLIDEEYRLRSEQNTRRIKAWALEFLRFLDSPEAGNE